jgi:hypothetical protein
VFFEVLKPSTGLGMSTSIRVPFFLIETTAIKGPAAFHFLALNLAVHRE